MANELARHLAAELNEPSLQVLIADVEAGTATAAAVRAWAQSHRAAVIAAVARRLPPVPALAAELQRMAAISAAGWHPRATVGPASVGVDADAVVVDVAEEKVVIGLLPPSGATFALSAGPAQGGGTLTVRDGVASGALGLRLGAVDVTGFVRLSEINHEPSVAIVLGTRFLPPIQLSFGFALTGVGGVVGVNRRIATDEIRRRLADGTALGALFPENPARDGPALLNALETILPPAAGSHVVGPTATLTWLDLGPLGSVARLDLGVLLQLPEATIVIVGRARLDLPVVLSFRLDVTGTVDPGRGLVAMDAALVDSRALAIFRVTGTGAFRMSGSHPPYVVATLGGFYPGFWPEPAVIPPQQRLALALDVPCELSFHAGGYLAITSNSIQAGADIHVGIDLAAIEAEGFLRFDAIAHFDPFHIHADYAAGWRVSIGPFSGGTTVSGWIDGPGPWTIHARVSVDLLIDDVSWSDTFSIGPPGPPRPPPSESLARLLEPALGNAANVHAVEAVDPHVLVRPTKTGSEGRAVASPLGRLRWTQSLVPLRTEVAKAGGRPLAVPDSVDVTVTGPPVSATGPADDWFAPGQFMNLTAAETMSMPAFQRMPAGVEIQLGEHRGATHPATLDFIQYVRRPSGWSPFGDGEIYLHASRLFAMTQATAAAAVVEDRTPLVVVKPERFVVTANSSRPPDYAAVSAAQALALARRGGVAHSTSEAPVVVGVI